MVLLHIEDNKRIDAPAREFSECSSSERVKHTDALEKAQWLDNARSKYRNTPSGPSLVTPNKKDTSSSGFREILACLATVHIEKRPSRVLPAVVVTPQEAAVGPKVRQTRQRLMHEDVVAIYLANIGPKSFKTAARLAAEFGITGKAVRDVWRGKTWANQTRCMWTVQSAKGYISPAPSSTAAAARVKRALGRV